MMKVTKRSAKRGFTLIELMIVVAIIGILAAVAIPKFADLIDKSKEGSTKGSLGSIRSALSVYYGDTEGQYPGNLAGLTTKYIASVPYAKLPGTGHGDLNTEIDISSTVATNITNAGGWAYVNAMGNEWGTVLVNCTHTDKTKGVSWTTY